MPLSPTGGSLQLAFNNNKQSTNSVFSTFNPTFNSNLNLSLTQPLLRNLRIDQPRNQLRIARKNREISDVQFHATIVNTVANVKGYYYDLIYAFDNLEAARQNLELARRLLNENEIRVKVGTMAPLDVVTAQAEVASREVDVITAENTLAQAQDNLKQAIFPANDPAMWGTQVIPVDRPGRRPDARRHRRRRAQRIAEPHRRGVRAQEHRDRRLQRCSTRAASCCPSSTWSRATAAPAPAAPS